MLSHQPPVPVVKSYQVTVRPYPLPLKPFICAFTDNKLRPSAACAVYISRPAASWFHYKIIIVQEEIIIVQQEIIIVFTKNHLPPPSGLVTLRPTFNRVPAAICLSCISSRAKFTPKNRDKND